MNQTSSNAALRRKATVGRQEHEARAMSPIKAVRLALEKAAEEDLGLALSVAGVERSEVSHSEAVAMLENDCLLMLLEGPDGQQGAMSVDIELLSALIEVQTIGRVVSRPAEVRAITPTDAAIAMPLVNGMLARFTQNLESKADGFWAGGYRFGSRLPDRRVMGLALGDLDYNCLRLNIEIAEGERVGAILLLLPVLAKPAVPDVTPIEVAQNGPKLEAAVMATQATLDVVLGRISLPLSALRAMTVGEILRVPRDAVQTATIETMGHKKIASGQVGQLGGQRAVRLTAANGAKANSGKPKDSTTATTAGKPPLADIMDAEVVPEPFDLPDLPASTGMPDLAATDIGTDLPDLSEFEFTLDLGLEDGAKPHDLPDLDSLLSSGG